jgi:hypothetical protein
VTYRSSERFQPSGSVFSGVASAVNYELRTVNCSSPISGADDQD